MGPFFAQCLRNEAIMWCDLPYFSTWISSLTCSRMWLSVFKIIYVNIKDSKLKWNLWEYFPDICICSFYLIRNAIIEYYVYLCHYNLYNLHFLPFWPTSPKVSYGSFRDQAIARLFLRSRKWAVSFGPG